MRWLTTDEAMEQGTIHILLACMIDHHADINTTLLIAIYSYVHNLSFVHCS